MQQVYHQSAFGRVPSGGAFLTRIFFRAACNSQGGWIVTNLQFNLSTTSIAPDQLSASFASNIGSDETIVYGPKPTAIDTQASGCGSSFDRIDFELDNPFFYNPADGNLLLDIRNFGSYFPSDPHGGPQVGDSHLDAPARLGDTISRIAALAVDAEAATVVDTSGLTTGFQFDPFPVLGVQLTNDTIVLRWPYFPTTFRLQSTDKLSADAVWENFQGEIGGDTGTLEVKLPVDALTQKRFFRLYWNSPQPGVDPRSTGGAP